MATSDTVLTILVLVLAVGLVVGAIVYIFMSQRKDSARAKKTLSPVKHVKPFDAPKFKHKPKGFFSSEHTVEVVREGEPEAKSTLQAVKDAAASVARSLNPTTYFRGSE